MNGPVRDRARDLDIAVLTKRGRSTLELLAELSDLTRLDAIDLLDLGRAGPVATVEALLHGEVLFEREPGTADRSSRGRRPRSWTPSGCATGRSS